MSYHPSNYSSHHDYGEAPHGGPHGGPPGRHGRDAESFDQPHGSHHSAGHRRSDRAYADCLNGNLHEAVSAWFLGPQAENLDMLKGLFAETANLQAQSRLAYYPEDGKFITNAIRESSTFKAESQELIDVFGAMTKLLFDNSVPFFSQRYAGHMCFETSLPGILGWAATVLCNPNNVAFEASPITTQIELHVGLQMCKMLGYEKTESEEPWGHIACDGTVANLESIWVARNLKYYPLSLRDAMKSGNELEGISEQFMITLPTDPNTPVLFSSLQLWQLLNLPSKTILDIPKDLYDQCGITSTYLDSVLTKYIVQTRGKQALEADWGMQKSPNYFISATRHYSWPKGAAIAGLGKEYMVDIPVDHDARVNVTKLRERLEDALRNKTPVFAVVGIIGSTEEGSVDPLEQILDLRDEYEKKGLCFLVHADAAWGGYFASMIRDRPKEPRNGRWRSAPDRDFVPSQTLREYTVKQLHALARTDTITIDPHKAGYIPYPAGGLCYRDGRMRYQVTWSAPYLAESDESIGIYGVEGSKPGAPAVAAFLHHKIVGLHKEGHGALLGEATWSCRRIAAHWSAMSVDKDDFIVVPFNALSSEPDHAAVEQEKQFIRENILGKSNEAIAANDKAMEILCGLGSDLNINAFACNFRINGKVNTDVEEANYLNNSIFKRLSITTPKYNVRDIPMFLSSTTFKLDEYRDCATNFKKRLGLETESAQDLFVLRNVVMSPFQTAGDFVQNVANIFQKVLEEEMHHVVSRNTIKPQHHSFVAQGLGSGKAFLTYRPYFHNANGRFQAILAADIEQPTGGAKLEDIAYELTTKDNVNLDDICKDGASFAATISKPDSDVVVKGVRVSNIRVLKKRPLGSRWRDATYPTTYVPFYLYGEGDRYFVDHMLLQAPNVQISAPVTLNLDGSIPATDLAKGALLSVHRSEAAMQPVDEKDMKSIAWFEPGSKVKVSVYADPNAATAHGPGLSSAIGKGKPIATGTMTVGKATYRDCQRINTQDFTKEQRASHRMVNPASGAAHAETKKEWAQFVKSYFE